MRAAASALTRCSSSLARSGARPAHSRRRLISRAWENASSESSAIPTSATNPAIAPTLVKELVSERARGRAVIACTRFDGSSWIPGVYEGRRRLGAASRDGLRELGAHRRELCHLCGQTRGVALEHEQAYLVEHRFDRLGRQWFALRAHDLLGRRRLWLLVAVEQLLVQLLSCATAHDLDRHVAIRIEARELDHGSCEIDDPDRFAHVEHKNVRPTISIGDERA